MLVTHQEGVEAGQVVILTQGIPASGKSTWAKQVCRTDLRFKRVSRDDLRWMLFDSAYEPKFEDLITNIEQGIVYGLLAQGFNVVVDATHIKPEYIKRWVEFINTSPLPSKVQILVKQFQIDPAEALLRNSRRDAKERVPDYVIRRMYMNMQNLPLLA
jgi:predicted kinase